MFRNITENYSHQDASLEILVMLLGACLLGGLLGWFIHERSHQKAYSSNIRTRKEPSYEITIKDHPRDNEDKIKINEEPINPTASKGDNLSKIEGISKNLEATLKNKGIYLFSDLHDIEEKRLSKILKHCENQPKEEVIQSWPHQTSLAIKGEWEKLFEYQLLMQKAPSNNEGEKNQTVEVNKPLVSNSVEKSEEREEATNPDDLKVIDGIGPRIQEILNEEDIYTFEDLSKTDAKTIKSYLDHAGSQFMQHDPTTWPHQASLAAKEEWRRLDEYQDYRKVAQSLASSPEAESSPSLYIKKDISAKKVDNEDTKKVGSDDLKMIEGIGPKIEKLLHKAGIDTFKKLKNTERSSIQALLDEAGSQFKMYNPGSWPYQAEIAEKGEWEKLEEYQDFLFGDRE